MNDDLTDHVVRTAERMESFDDPFNAIDELQPLDVTAEVSLSSDSYRNITLTVATGGPRIEINVSRGTVSGYWGGDSHTTHFDNEAVADELHDYYVRQFKQLR